MSDLETLPTNPMCVSFNPENGHMLIPHSPQGQLFEIGWDGEPEPQVQPGLIIDLPLVAQPGPAAEEEEEVAVEEPAAEPVDDDDGGLPQPPLKPQPPLPKMGEEEESTDCTVYI